MKQLFVKCLMLFSIMCVKWAHGQSLSSEITGMERSWAVSGSFNTSLTKSRKFNFSNVSRISSGYEPESDLRALVLSNVSYAFSPNYKTTLGAMYTTTSGFTPTLGFQMTGSRKLWQWMVFPNLNVSKTPDVMTLSMIQYLHSMSTKVKFVFRIQSLDFINGRGHLFSTFRFRSGFVRGRCQFGAASDLNLRGNEFDFEKSVGVFLQCQVF